MIVCRGTVQAVIEIDSWMENANGDDDQSVLRLVVSVFEISTGIVLWEQHERRCPQRVWHPIVYGRICPDPNRVLLMPGQITNIGSGKMHVWIIPWMWW